MGYSDSNEASFKQTSEYLMHDGAHDQLNTLQ